MSKCTFSLFMNGFKNQLCQERAHPLFNQQTRTVKRPGEMQFKSVIRKASFIRWFPIGLNQIDCNSNKFIESVSWGSCSSICHAYLDFKELVSFMKWNETNLQQAFWKLFVCKESQRHSLVARKFGLVLTFEQRSNSLEAHQKVEQHWLFEQGMTLNVFSDRWSKGSICWIVSQILVDTNCCDLLFCVWHAMKNTTRILNEFTCIVGKWCFPMWYGGHLSRWNLQDLVNRENAFTAKVLQVNQAKSL